MATRSAAELLTLSVRLRGLALGRAVDLFLDRDDLRLVGIEVLCGDDEHRFLPVAAAKLADVEIAITSPLVLLESPQVEFYRSRTFSFGAIRGCPVRRRDREVGVLRDVRFDGELAVTAIVVELDGREDTLPFDDSIRFDPRSRSAA
jgi:hypothetical protein